MGIDANWLTKPADLRAEMAETYTPSLKDDWDRLLAKMVPGDELWHFEPPTEHDIPTGGVALVRRGQVVSKVVYWVA